jgi:hypothetical protein
MVVFLRIVIFSFGVHFCFYKIRSLFYLLLNATSSLLKCFLIKIISKTLQ